MYLYFKNFNLLTRIHRVDEVIIYLEKRLNVRTVIFIQKR